MIHIRLLVHDNVRTIHSKDLRACRGYFPTSYCTFSVRDRKNASFLGNSNIELDIA